MNVEEPEIKLWFSPYTSFSPIQVEPTGVVYEIGEHQYYKTDKVIEVVDKHGNWHDAFESELSENPETFKNNDRKNLRN